MDLQVELDAAMAIERSFAEVQAALIGMDAAARRAVLIRALALTGIAEAPTAELCVRCKASERATGKLWCGRCIAAHSEKLKATRHPDTTRLTPAERETIKRRAAYGRGDCTRCLKERAADGKRWCGKCREEYDAKHRPAKHKDDAPVTERQPTTEADAAQNAKAPEPDREIVEESILKCLRDGPKDLFTITKAVWGISTLEMQRRAKKILWAMKFDGIIGLNGGLYVKAGR